MDVRLSDGVTLHVQEVGAGFPIFVLHGGPGLDRPWLDPLGEDFRLFYVDERGQGRSERVDAATASFDVYARDVDRLAEALGLDEFAVLGHSVGAVVATYHANEVRTARAYVISSFGSSPGSGRFPFSGGYLAKPGHVDKPTLVLVGEEERNVAMHVARALHAEIADSELVVVPGVGNMTFVEAPEPYLDAVRDFLRRVTA